MTKTQIEIEKHIDLVGKVPDGIIADLVGVSCTTILLYRRDRGIPPYKDFYNREARSHIVISPKKPKTEKGEIRKPSHTCDECGNAASNKFKGGHLCDQCFNRDYVPLSSRDYVYSGRSTTCCFEN